MKNTCLLIVLTVVISGPLAGCSVNPATGRSQFNVISESREVNLGKEAAPEFLNEYGGEVPDAQVVNYVRTLGHQLAEVSERPTLPWEFHVVDSSVINAFALPGGKVFISRGLLGQMQNEAQLAGVLGHEVGHVTAQHIGQQMSRAISVQAIAIGIGIAGEASDSDYLRVLGVGASTGGGVYLLKYGRDQESEADMLGLRYMTKLGYDPNAQVAVMGILKGASEGGGRPPEFLSTHPYPETRVKRLQALITKQYPDAGKSGVYKFNQAEFKRNALDRLAKLPPARHGSTPAKKKKKSMYEAARDYYEVSTSPACDCVH